MRRPWMFICCAFCATQALSVTPLIYYTHSIIAGSPDLKKFDAVMTYVKPPEWDKPISRIVPTDDSCSVAGSEYPKGMSAEQAQRFVEERSVAGSVEIIGEPPPETRWPLVVQLRSGEPPWTFIKEGETMILKSLRGTPITVRISSGKVFVGGYQAKLDFNGSASDGSVVVVDGCGKLT